MNHKKCNRHQAQKTTYCLTSIIWDVQKKHTETESWLVVPWDWMGTEINHNGRKGSDWGD